MVLGSDFQYKPWTLQKKKQFSSSPDQLVNYGWCMVMLSGLLPTSHAWSKLKLNQQQPRTETLLPTVCSGLPPSCWVQRIRVHILVLAWSALWLGVVHMLWCTLCFWMMALSKTCWFGFPAKWYPTPGALRRKMSYRKNLGWLVQCHHCNPLLNHYWPLLATVTHYQP